MSSCNTCQGYGLWAMGTPVPMYTMDAHDGMPTVPCPECGADHNPVGVERPEPEPISDEEFMEQIRQIAEALLETRDLDMLFKLQKEEEE